MTQKEKLETNNQICEILREELPVLRAKLRVSQDSIAKAIGISRQTYSSIETGNREMSLTVFWALIAYFQNKELTQSMLVKIDGLYDGMKDIMEES